MTAAASPEPCTRVALIEETQKQRACYYFYIISMVARLA